MKGAWPFLFLLLFNLLFFNPVLRQGQMFVTAGLINSDLLNQNYPLKDFYASQIKQGHLPLWCDQFGNGFPILAEGQAGVLYPLNLLIFYLLPMPLAFSFSLALHYLLTSWGMYWLARQAFHLTKVPSLVASLSFAYGSFMISHLSHLNLTQVVTWLPIALLGLELRIQSRLSRSQLIVILVITQSLSILAGHPSAFFFNLLFLGFYTIVRSSHLKVRGSIFRAEPLMELVLAVLVSLGITAAQLLPTWELLQLSSRNQGFSYQASTFYKVTGGDMLSFFRAQLPMFSKPVVANLEEGTHSPWESYLYQGWLIPPLLCLGTYFLLKKNHLPKAVLVTGLFGFLFFLGRATPLYEILWRTLPLMTKMRYSTRFLVAWQIVASLLAAAGAHWLLQRQKMITKKVLAPALLIVLSADLYCHQQPINPLGKAEDWLKPPPAAVFLKENLNGHRFYSSNANAFDPHLVSQPNQQLAFKNILPTNYHLLFQIPNISPIIGGFLPKREEELTELASRAALWAPQKEEIIPLPAFNRLLQVKGAKYALTDLPLSSPDFQLVHTYPLDPPQQRLVLLTTSQNWQADYDWGTVTTKQIYLYEKQMVNPPARLFYHFQAATSDSEALQLLSQGDFSLGERVILTQPPSDLSLGAPPTETEKSRQVKLLKDSDQEKIYLVDTPAPAILATTDYSYPGWVVYVNNQKKPLLTANYNFKAVALEEKGSSEVRFHLESASFARGLKISLVCLALTSLGTIFTHKEFFLKATHPQQK